MIYKNGFICDKNRYEKKDIRVIDGLIVDIDDNIEPNSNEEVVDCINLVIMPKMIDLNVSLKDNKLNVKNISDIASKAQKSGFSTVVIRSDCTPKIDNETIVELISTKKALRNLDNIQISCNSLTNDDKLSNIATLTKMGCIAIETDSDINSNNLLRIAQYSKMKDVPIFAKCFNKSLSYDKVMNDGEVSAFHGLRGVEDIAFTSEVAKILEIAKYTNSKMVVQSISLSESLELISLAKNSNSNIFSEVSIAHLCFSDENCANYNTSFKLFPPLVSSSQKNSLFENLKNNKIDMITSLSCEISNINKDLPFDEADYGIDIMENFFSLCYTKLVKEKIINLSKLSELISFNQAKVLGYDNYGLIEKGYKSELLFVNLDKELIINNDSVLNDFTLYGEIIDL
jgi:dihydroorotase